MAEVVSGDARLHVVALGAEQAGRPAVVMLHGLLLGNVATWYFTAAPVLARDRAVRLFDLRGHGASSRPASGYDLATMADDLAAVVEQVAGPVDLVGHSFGALVALRYALDHPGGVRRVVLVEAPVPPGAPSEIATFLDQDPEAMIQALPAGLRQAVAGGRRQARRLLAHLAGLTTQTSLLGDLAAIEPFAAEELARCQVPVLGVYGDRSSCREQGLVWVRDLPNGEGVVLPGGHYLHLDSPDALTETIVGWLDG